MSALPIQYSSRAAVGRSAAAEVEDPRVLQEPADDRADGDVLAQPGHPGAQRADAAHREVDLHAGPRGAVERVDHRSSTIEFIFMPNQAARAGPLVLDLPLDPVDDAGADGMRGHQQVPVFGLPGVAGQHVEQVGQVRADIRVGGQQAEILVDAGRLRVVVAGADVAVAAQVCCPPGGSPAPVLQWVFRPTRP